MPNTSDTKARIVALGARAYNKVGGRSAQSASKQGRTGRQAIPRFVPGTLLNKCRLHKSKKHTVLQIKCCEITWMIHVQSEDEIPTIKELWSFLGYFKIISRTGCTNSAPTSTLITLGTCIQSKAQLNVSRGADWRWCFLVCLNTPCWVLAHHLCAHGISFEDDLYIYASLNTGLKVLV